MAIFPLNLDTPALPECRGGVIAIGNFDGVHLGHQALLAEVVRQSQSLQTAPIAVTFDPHPLELLRPETFQPPLTTLERRADLLQQAGARHVIVIQTTSAFLRHTAQEFIERVICKSLAAKAVVEGWNFRFGKDRLGDPQMLVELGRQSGVAVTLLPPHDVGGRVVSSSVVREALLTGAVAAAAVCLGRCYRLEGKVEADQQRGRTLGFPTANLHQVRTLIPGDGVFAAVAWERGTAWPAAVNIGPNPTFGEQGHKVEVHLIGFQGNLYGQMVAVDLVQKLRSTRPFANVRELIAQIQKDVAEAASIAHAHLGQRV